MKPIFVRSPYNYDMMEASNASGLLCKDKSLAQQHFKEECDINTIVERFGLTGQMPQVLQLPAFGDYTGIFDYQTAMNQVVAAREAFMTLPAKIRARFHNDPQELLEFCNDDDNRDEAIKLGLVNRPAPAAPPAPEAPTAPQAQPQGAKPGVDTPTPNPKQ